MAPKCNITFAKNYSLHFEINTYVFCESNSVIDSIRTFFSSKKRHALLINKQGSYRLIFVSITDRSSEKFTTR